MAIDNERIDAIQKEAIALRIVLKMCTMHVGQIIDQIALYNTEEVFEEKCEVHSQPLDSSETILSAKEVREEEAYKIATAGKYYGTPIDSLAKVNPRGLKDWAKKSWKSLDDKDREYIKQMLKDGRL